MTIPLTKLASFQSLVRICESLPLTSPDEAAFVSALSALQAELSKMRNRFLFDLQFWCHLESIAALGEQVEMTFTLLDVQVEELSEAPETQLLDVLAYLSVSINRLFELFAQIQTIVEQQETYSRAPHVNELIRVAYATLEGQLPLEALEIRRDAYLETFHLSVVGLESSTQDLSPEQKQRVTEALDALEEGLELIGIFLQQPQAEESLEEGLALVEEGAHLLTELECHLLAESERFTEITCLRCGSMNVTTTKICASCGATLPILVESSQSRFDIRLEEGRVVSSQTEHPEILSGVFSALVSYLEGGPATKALKANLANYARKLHAFKHQLSRVENTEMDSESQQQTTLQSLYEKLSSEVKDCADILSELRNSLSEDSRPKTQELFLEFEQSVERFQFIQQEWLSLSN